MRVTQRIGLLAAAGGLAVTACTVGTSAPAGAAEVLSGATTVQVDGTLLMAQPDGPGARPSYAVALAGGDLVPVDGPLSDARPMSHVTARLALPASVLSRLAARGISVRSGATLDATSTAARQALRLVDRRSLTLPIAGAPVLTDPEPAVTPTAHQQFVAALDNKGALGQTDTPLLGHVTAVGSYWQGESNGAISSIGVPATVTHYDTAISTTDCGLGDDFWTVVQEAEGKFPGINPFGGSDQLVLFVPPACSSGGVVGEGTVGSSFASGGALIVKAGSAIEGTYAHETGHNYGFDHANARYSGTSTGVLRHVRRDGLRPRWVQPADRPQHAVPGVPGDHRRGRDPGRGPRHEDDGGARDRDHQAAQRRHRSAQCPGRRPRHGGGALPRLPLGHRGRRGRVLRRHDPWVLPELQQWPTALRPGCHHQRRARREWRRHPGGRRLRRHVAGRRCHLDQRVRVAQHPRVLADRLGRRRQCRLHAGTGLHDGGEPDSERQCHRRGQRRPGRRHLEPGADDAAGPVVRRRAALDRPQRRDPGGARAGPGRTAGVRAGSPRSERATRRRRSTRRR